MSQSSSPKVVVITGGSAGIGATLAARFAAAGHKLVLAARREAELTAVAGPLGAMPVATDVTDRAQVEALCARALEAHGRIDVCVNNAGRVPFAPLRSAYSASKHFLNALTANLRMELTDTHPGITVSLFTPSVVPRTSA